MKSLTVTGASPDRSGFLSLQASTPVSSRQSGIIFSNKRIRILLGGQIKRFQPLRQPRRFENKDIFFRFV